MKHPILALLVPALISWMHAAEPTVIPLWPEGVPGLRADASPEKVVENRTTNIHDPSITLYPAANAKPGATAVIICPGGGYRWLAMETEGVPIAAWFNARGVDAFVLKYRAGEYPHPAPLRDVLRAIRTVRSQAPKWGVKADRIGVIGFSAGGHLASSAATLFDAPEGKTGVALDAVSARPDFVMLIYPVITMKDPFAHKGSRGALLGNTPTPDSIDRLSTDQQVTKETPPTFLVHGNDDNWVPPENSLRFYEALRHAGVPAELHLFEHGPHGMAMNPGISAATEWPEMLESWLSLHGWISAADRAPKGGK